MITFTQQPTSGLVSISDGEPTTTSLKVAEAFSRRHADILRAIKTLDCSKEFTERNFAPSEYRDRTGRPLPYYRMTKNGFIFLVMGFKGETANTIKERYIAAFDLMADDLGGFEHLRHDVTGRFVACQRAASQAGKTLRQWQDQRPLLLRQMKAIEQAGQGRLEL